MRKPLAFTLSEPKHGLDQQRAQQDQLQCACAMRGSDDPAQITSAIGLSKLSASRPPYRSEKVDPPSTLHPTVRETLHLGRLLLKAAAHVDLAEAEQHVPDQGYFASFHPAGPVPGYAETLARASALHSAPMCERRAEQRRPAAQRPEKEKTEATECSYCCGAGEGVVAGRMTQVIHFSPRMLRSLPWGADDICSPA